MVTPPTGNPCGRPPLKAVKKFTLRKREWEEAQLQLEPAARAAKCEFRRPLALARRRCALVAAACAAAWSAPRGPGRAADAVQSVGAETVARHPQRDTSHHPELLAPTQCGILLVDVPRVYVYIAVKNDSQEEVVTEYPCRVPT